MSTNSPSASSSKQGLRLSITMPSGAQLSPSAYQITSVLESSITATVDFGGAAGPCAAVVRKPDGQSSNPFGFAVVLDPGPNTRSGVISQVASAGNWKTAVTLLNLNPTAATVRVVMTGEDGSPLQLPLVVTQAVSSISLVGSAGRDTVGTFVEDLY